MDWHLCRPGSAGTVGGVPNPLSLPFDPIVRADELWTERWGSTPSMAAITSVMRAQQILLAEVDAALKPSGLTFARYEALVLLSFSRSGELPMSKIGARLMVHPTSVTNTVDRLSRAGLVVKRRNPEDGRGVLAAITDEGRALVEEATRALTRIGFGLGDYREEACREVFDVLRPLRVSAGDFAPEDADEEAASDAGGSAVGQSDGEPVDDHSAEWAAGPAEARGRIEDGGAEGVGADDEVLERG